MKSSVKIIKRRRDEDSNDLKTSDGEKPVERGTREMVSTVKSWITELQKRKGAQGHSFAHLTVVATAPESQNIESLAQAESTIAPVSQGMARAANDLRCTCFET